MANIHKNELLATIGDRYGAISRLPGSQSLFIIGNNAARVYFRYSKVHEGGKTFFGLREIDLRQLEGHNSFLCFQLDDGTPPVFIPFADFEEVFRSAQAANDGQHKVQIIAQKEGHQLYVARKGRFNIEGYIGLGPLERSIAVDRLKPARNLSHTQVQTLLGSIGHMKGHDVWIPDNNAGGLDWSIAERFPSVRSLPAGFGDVASVLAEIDVLWMTPGSNRIEALFEIEHSTPVYTGLLRFNDALLTEPTLTRFHIVSNEIRRAIFSRQAFRPTFRKSGLSELVSFLEYRNVFDWHARLAEGGAHNER